MAMTDGELRDAALAKLDEELAQLKLTTRGLKGFTPPASSAWGKALKAREEAIALIKQVGVTPTPPPVEWVKIADENAKFNLGEGAKVRYGKDTKWVEKTLPAGVHTCNNATFTDPVTGVTKQCEVVKGTEVLPLPPDPEPEPEPPPTGKIQWAVNASDWYDGAHNPNLVRNLGAKVVREARHAPISTGDIDRYKNAGIKILWEVNVGASAANITSSLRSRPGAFWGVEYGNENSYRHNNPNYTSPTPAAYAQGAKAAGQACKAEGVKFGIQIGSCALYRGSEWIDGMFAAVPDLQSYFDAWILHPYGPPRGSSLNRAGDPLENGGERRIEAGLAHAQKHNATNKAWWFTEWGLAFNYPNAIALDDNYGWIRNMSPAQAKQALDESEAMWQRKFGAKLTFVSVYHDFDTHGSGTGRESYFGTVKKDGSTKGPFTDAVKAHLAS